MCHVFKWRLGQSYGYEHEDLLFAGLYVRHGLVLSSTVLKGRFSFIKCEKMGFMTLKITMNGFFCCLFRC